MSVDPRADTRVEQDPWVGRTVDGYKSIGQRLVRLHELF